MEYLNFPVVIAAVSVIGIIVLVSMRKNSSNSNKQ